MGNRRHADVPHPPSYRRGNASGATSTIVPGMEDPRSQVVGALLIVLDAELYAAGLTRADLARHLGVPPSTVKRRLEGAGAAKDLDRLVAAVAAVVGKVPLEFWARALSVGSSPDMSREDILEMWAEGLPARRAVRRARLEALRDQGKLRVSQ